jgi:hypothetical protein
MIKAHAIKHINKRDPPLLKAVSGQAINSQKSKIFFSTNTLAAYRKSIKRCFASFRSLR